MAVQEVNGIIPKEVVDAVRHDEDVVEALQEENKANNKKQAKDDKEFNKLRQGMIAKALGVSRKELETYYADYQAENDGDTRQNDNRADKLKRARGIFKVQRGANNNDKKDTIKGVVTSLGALLIGSTILSSFITLPVQIAACTVGIGYSLYRYNKRKGGNRFDEHDKQEHYEELLNSFMDDAKKLDDAIMEDREAIEKAKSVMSKREYKRFRNDYLKSKIEELNIETPFIKDNEVNSSLSKMPDSINTMLNKNSAAEVVA